MKRIIIILASAAVVFALIWFVPHSPLRVALENPARAASSGTQSPTAPFKGNAPSGTVTAIPYTAVSVATSTGEGPAGKNIPVGWQLFKHATLGYSLIYPLIWANNQVSWYSQEFTEIQQEASGVGPPLRLYVSVYPKDYTNQNTDANHFVYHFIPFETIQEFMALPVGEAMLKEPDAVPPGAFTYTRLPDRKVAGETALVIENPKVWEAPIGTKDRIVIFVTKDTIQLLGMNYETPEQLAMFEQVLDNFQPGPSVESTPAGNRVAYQNISFDIPVSLSSRAFGATVAGSPGPVDPAPEYVQFTFNGYPFNQSGGNYAPQIRVYSAQEYAAVSSWATESLKRLTRILDDPSSPMTNDTLPNVPYMGAATQLYAAQVKQIAFQNGNGVRMISSYAQYPAAISQFSSFYHYEGLTQDRLYWVVVEMPVVLPVYADESNPGEFGITYERKDWSEMGPYYQAVTDLLNRSDEASFTPALSQLDALVQSITVQGSSAGMPADSIQIVEDNQLGFNVTLPRNFEIANANPGQALFLGPGAGHPTENRVGVSVTVEPANGRTAEQVANQVAEQAKLEMGNGYTGASITSMIIDNEPAFSVNQLPGQDINRQLFIVHGGQLYHLMFVPDTPRAAAYYQMEDVFALIINTFRFTG